MADAPIGIAGSGRVARALGRLLYESGAPVCCVASRTPEHGHKAAEWIGPGVEAVCFAELGSRVRRVLVAVSDGVISDVTARIAAGGSRVCIALHTCGARGADVLEALRAHGAACGVLHPLQTVDGSAEALRGAPFGVWGDDAAAVWAEEIAAAAGGRVLRIPESCAPLYHAAAVMASNYVVALLSAAQATLMQAGVAESEALRVLAPLVRTAVENTLRHGPAASLTGPIERGDLETVAAHLRAMPDLPATVRDLYRAAGLQTVEVARRRGLPHDAAAALERILKAG